MAEILTKEMIEQATEGSIVEGLVYLRYLKKTISSKNTPYLSGEIETKAKFEVVMWSRCPDYAKLENIELLNTLVLISGTISEFGGHKNIQLNSVTPVDAATYGVNLDDLKVLKYKKDVYAKCLLDEVNKNLSPKGVELFNLIFKPEEVDGLWNKFIIEYAAKKFHDNCESGLLAHTYKCLRLFKYLVGPYKWLEQLQTAEIPDSKDILDLLYLGIILHDIGKVFEMNEGIYVPDSFNTHRILGLEVLFENKNEIISRYNSHWYQALISIINGHHNGANGSEPARTLYAYIVHKVDEMDATFTGLGQIIETSTNNSVEGAKITWEDNILSL